MTKNGWWVSVPGARRVMAENKHPLHVYIQIYFQAGKWTDEIAKPHVESNGCKTATGNGNLQPQIKRNE